MPQILYEVQHLEGAIKTMMSTSTPKASFMQWGGWVLCTKGLGLHTNLDWTYTSSKLIEAHHPATVNHAQFRWNVGASTLGEPKEAFLGQKENWCKVLHWFCGCRGVGTLEGDWVHVLLPHAGHNSGLQNLKEYPSPPGTCGAMFDVLHGVEVGMFSTTPLILEWLCKQCQRRYKGLRHVA